MAGATALSIGNFDGVHRGHLALVRAARRAAGPDGRVVVLSFEPHPLTVLRPAVAPARLSRLEQRRGWLAAAGADEVLPVRPAPELLGLTPQQFMGRVAAEHRPDVVVEGPDFRFWRDRRGSVETLRELGGALGFEVVVIDPVEAALRDQHQVRVSSTAIRWLLERGRVGDAEALLGRPYELEAEVVAGDRKGRELDMPTANLRHEDCLLPADGVYAGRALAPDGRWYTAAVSVGTKPTFGVRQRVCEAHLVGYAGPVDAYGWTTRLRFLAWLREQLAFRRVEDLVHQMRRDVRHALAVDLDRPSGPAEPSRRDAPPVTVTAAPLVSRRPSLRPAGEQ